MNVDEEREFGSRNLRTDADRDRARPTPMKCRCTRAECKSNDAGHCKVDDNDCEDRISEAPESACVMCSASIEPDGGYCLGCARPLCDKHGVYRQDGTGTSSLFCCQACYENYTAEL